jgi:segregation and condensation protein B
MNKKALLEAALFMAANPLRLKDLSKLIGEDEETTLNLLEEIKREMEREDRGIYLVRSEDKFRFHVKPEYVRFVRHLTPYSELKKGLLRVLALVAYKQPITQSEIVKVIGNRTYEYVRELEARGLIKTIRQGRTRALVPTKEFANYFGLQKPEDAKRFFEQVFEKKESSEKTENETVQASGE